MLAELEEFFVGNRGFTQWDIFFIRVVGLSESHRIISIDENHEPRSASLSTRNLVVELRI